MSNPSLDIQSSPIADVPLISQLLGEQKVVPVVVIENKDQARGLARALLDGGVNVIEITLRHRYGISAIELIKKEFPEMLVLAGTVNSFEQMQAVDRVGVDGVISPGITPSLLKTAKDNGIPYLPGIATASEALIAIEAGLSECKLFPASVVGGVGALKAFSGPYPDLRFCPTGGVSEANYQEYLSLSNVMCVGGSWIASSVMIQGGRWSEITDQCRRLAV